MTAPPNQNGNPTGSDRSGTRPYVIAIVGAGPSGIYAAEALSQQTEFEVRVVVLDRLPVPFGLVRYGVAPDHHSIRSIRTTLERTLERSGVRFCGDVTIGQNLEVAELRGVVDAVIYAYGAGSDRRLGIAGEEVPGSIAAPEFVAWYCGHPDLHPDVHPVTERDLPETGSPLPRERAAELVTSTTSAVVVGVGNVALDVARVLVKTAAELEATDMADDVLAALRAKTVTDVHLLGRRGPAYTAFTTKELRELGQLPDLDLVVDPDDLYLDASGQAVIGSDKVAARNMVVLREWSDRTLTGASRRIWFHFWTRPVRLLGEDRVVGVETERTRLTADGYVEAAGPGPLIDAELVVRSVGYKGLALPGVPYDPSTGRVPNAEGHVIRDGAFSDGEFVTGWIKRGPTGVIGTNRSDAAETVASLVHDLRDGALTATHDPAELDALLTERGLHPLDLPAWRRIDAAEIELGHQHGRERTTLARRSELLAAADDPADDPTGDSNADPTRERVS